MQFEDQTTSQTPRGIAGAKQEGDAEVKAHPAASTQRREPPAFQEQCAVLLERGWLAEQPAALRREVVERGRIRRYGRGESIFRRGEPSGGIYGVVAGSVIYLFPGQPQAYLAHSSQPGSWFGEPSMLRRRPRLVTVIANEAPTTVFHLPLAAFEDIVAREPWHWRSFAALAAAHNELLLRMLADLRRATPKARIAARLLGLLDDDPPGFARPGQRLYLTQSGLGEMAAVSRHTANRVLLELAERGIVAVGYGHLVVRDVEGLRRAACQSEEASDDDA
jgi:CRP-like cAMP-binding protein